MPEREILNIGDAAAFLGVSVKTFSKVLREEDVPGRKVGREWKFSRQALIDWVGTSRSRTFLDVVDVDKDGRTRKRKPTRRRSRKPNTDDGFSVDEL
jgi:excisionase family DNA binding protein